jgi:hypothetical protein
MSSRQNDSCESGHSAQRQKTIRLASHFLAKETRMNKKEKSILLVIWNQLPKSPMSMRYAGPHTLSSFREPTFLAFLGCLYNSLCLHRPGCPPLLLSPSVGLLLDIHSTALCFSFHSVKKSRMADSVVFFIASRRMPWNRPQPHPCVSFSIHHSLINDHSQCRKRNK